MFNISVDASSLNIFRIHDHTYCRQRLNVFLKLRDILVFLDFLYLLQKLQYILIYLDSIGNILILFCHSFHIH